MKVEILCVKSYSILVLVVCHHHHYRHHRHRHHALESSSIEFFPFGIFPECRASGSRRVARTYVVLHTLTYTHSIKKLCAVTLAVWRSHTMGPVERDSFFHYKIAFNQLKQILAFLAHSFGRAVPVAVAAIISYHKFKLTGCGDDDRDDYLNGHLFLCVVRVRLASHRQQREWYHRTILYLLLHSHTHNANVLITSTCKTEIGKKNEIWTQQAQTI